MRLFKIISYGLLCLLVIAFAALNSNDVSINLYVKVIRLPISIITICMIGVGMIIGFFLTLSKYLRAKLTIRKLKEELKMSQKEINNLRSIPLKDQH